MCAQTAVASGGGASPITRCEPAKKYSCPPVFITNTECSGKRLTTHSAR